MATLAAIGITALLMAGTTPTRAVANPLDAAARSDSAAIAGVVDQFHRALTAGDSATAARLLHGDAVVMESGDLETRADYLRHHLPADIAFARAVRTDRRLHRLTQRGDHAWVAATSRTTGEFDGRLVDSDDAELMVLHRTPEGWRIVAIHWSSRRHRP